MPRKTERKRVPVSVIDAITEQALRGQVREPDLAKMLNHWFDLNGGERGVAVILYGEFTAANPGSLTRQRILQMIMHIMAKQAEKRPQQDDLGLLTEEDLDDEIDQIAVEMGDGEGEETGRDPGPEAEAEAPPPADSGR